MNGPMVRRALGLLLIATGCAALGALAAGLLGANRSVAPTRTETAARRATAPALCGTLAATVTGRVADPALNELSGLVASRTRPGLLYTHEDSGAGPQLWALRADGRLAGGWTVAGAGAIDWEDLATGPADGQDGAVLYLGDIGDNAERRPFVDIYRVDEPAAGTAVTAPAQRMRLRYPDGARDAETLLADPRRGTLVIVTKELDGGRAYSVSAFRAGTETLRRGPRVDATLATAGDVSADGRIIAIRGYTSLSVWRRVGDEPITATLRRQPCRPAASFFEGQGEALSLSADGATARTVVEGAPTVLRRYRAQR